jgi:hypothetical protein
LLAALEPTTGNVRAHLLLDVDDARLTSMAITRGTTTERIESVDRAWRIVAPIEAPADPSNAHDLARRLAHLEAVRFVADEPSPDHGLRAPRFTVELGVVAEEGATEASPVVHRLRIGAAAPGGAYAQLDDDPSVFVLASTALDLVAQPLVDRGVLEVDAVLVDSVTLRRSGTAEVALQRRGGDWQSSSDAVDAEEARRIIAAIATIRVERAGAYGAPAASDGVGSPRVEIEIRQTPEAPEPRVRTLRIGSETMEGERRLVHVRRADLEVDLLVDSTQIDPLLGTD